jgi:hypothetical protein
MFTGALRGLVDQYGWQRVWAVSESLFGYPPTWEPSLLEILQLKSELGKP